MARFNQGRSQAELVRGRSASSSRAPERPMDSWTRAIDRPGQALLPGAPAGAPRRRVHGRPLRLRAERGSVLIEVMVGAVVVAIATSRS